MKYRLAIHGRDHRPGGSDPIPGLLPPASADAGDYPLTVLGLSGLRAYWRLGEGASPYADTSGYNPSNTAALAANAGTFGSTAMTQNVTPGLLPTATDDGAVAFNHVGTDSSDVARPLLEDADLSSRVNFDFAGGPMSVIARVKPATTVSSFWGSVVSFTLDHDSPDWVEGWALEVRFPTGEVRFFRGTGSGSQVTATTAAGAVTLGTAYTLAATYDSTTIRVYVNGAQAASITDTTDLPAVSSLNNIAIGGYGYDTAGTQFWHPFLGVVDEAAVFSSKLTDTEIAGLHTSAADGALAAGLVWTTDGAGSASWELPTIEVDY